MTATKAIANLQFVVTFKGDEMSWAGELDFDERTTELYVPQNRDPRDLDDLILDLIHVIRNHNETAKFASSLKGIRVTDEPEPPTTEPPTTKE